MASDSSTKKISAGDKAEAFGEYQLIRRIAVGGMAEIFLAHQSGVLGFKKQVVIKRIRPEFADDEEFVSMFVDEAKIAAQLSHPNIAQVFNLGKTDGQLFIAMELIEGLDCAKLVRTKGALPPSVVLAITIATLRALHYAHERSVIHRDISPHNILLSIDGAVKVTDFGIARAADRLTHTMPGVIKGKTAYMSPEQAMGLNLDGRSDMFATALTAYELFLGHRAYEADREYDMLVIAREAKLEPLHVLDTTIPKAVSKVFAQALAREPVERYATCQEFADALLVASESWAVPMRQDQLSVVARGALGMKVDPQANIETMPKKPARTWLWASLGLALAGVVVTSAWFLNEPPPIAVAPNAPTGVTTDPPLPPPPPPPTGRTAPTEVVPVETHGFVTLNASPWANVWVDGRKLGETTPIYNLKLTAGRHTVRFESPGAGKSKTVSIDIEAGKSSTKIVHF